MAFRVFDLSAGHWGGHPNIKTLETAKEMLMYWDDSRQIISYIFDKEKRVLHIPLEYKNEYPKHSERIARSIQKNESSEVKEVVFYKQ